MTTITTEPPLMISALAMMNGELGSRCDHDHHHGLIHSLFALHRKHSCKCLVLFSFSFSCSNDSLFYETICFFVLLSYIGRKWTSESMRYLAGWKWEWERGWEYPPLLGLDDLWRFVFVDGKYIFFFPSVFPRFYEGCTTAATTGSG
jgi:hypothetical protein